MIAIAALAAGGIIVCGALYAIFYALGRLSENPRFIRISVAGYVALFICTGALARALNLHGVWR